MEIKHNKQAELEFELLKERREILDWVNNNILDVLLLLEKVVEEGSIVNQGIYESLLMKVEQMKALKDQVVEKAQAEYDYAAQEIFEVEEEEELTQKKQDVAVVTSELHDSIGDAQRSINDIKKSFTVNEIILLKTLKNELQLKQIDEKSTPKNFR